MTLYILAAVFVVFLIILNLKIYIDAEYKLEPNKNRFLLKGKILFFNITFFDSCAKKENKDIKTEQDKNSDKKELNLNLERIEESFDKAVDALKYLKKRLVIDLFEIKIREGTTDAALTGIATGAAYALFSQMVSTLDRLFVLKEHYESVTPDFENVCFYINFNTKIHIKVAHAFKLLIKILKILKG